MQTSETYPTVESQNLLMLNACLNLDAKATLSQ